MGAHTNHDLKVHLVWIPKYRRKILTGGVAIRVRDLIRQIAQEHENILLMLAYSRSIILELIPFSLCAILLTST